MKFLFDLDGTLTDPMQGITKSVRYALNSFGIEVDDLCKLIPFIGPPLKDSFKEFYGFISKNPQEEGHWKVKMDREVGSRLKNSV